MMVDGGVHEVKASEDDEKSKGLLRKIKKREAKDIVERLCKAYNTTAEAARCPMKGSRKVTYLLSYGTVNIPECFYLDRKHIVLIPNGYTVAFEAHSQVWIARILFRRRNSNSPWVPAYEVVPVDRDGEEEKALSSELQDNTSAAFKIAMQKKMGTTEVSGMHRPNGRLFIGIFYDSIQFRLRKHLKKKLQTGALDTYGEAIKGQARDWILENEQKEGQKRLTMSSRRATTPEYIQNSSTYFGGGNGTDKNNMSSVGKGLVQSVMNYPMFTQQDSLLGPALSPGLSTASAGNQLFQSANNANGFFSQPVTSNGQIPLVPPPEPQGLNNSFNQFGSSPSSGSGVGSNAASGSVANSYGGQQDFDQAQSSFFATSSHPSTNSRKRSLVSNGKALVRAATAPAETMEAELEAVFKRVLASMDEKEGINEQELSKRLLKKLDNLKKMIIHKSKRRRTSNADISNFSGAGLMDPVKGVSSGSNFSSYLDGINSKLKQEGMGDAGFPGNFADDGMGFQNATDIPDVDFSELLGQVEGSVAPVVVGCNMTHEGLYLTLNVNKKGLTENELKTAYKCLRIPATSSLVKKTLQACDRNGDGKISMSEFLEYLKEREKELKRMFDQMDLTGDGYVTLEELKTARSQGLFEASDDEIQTLINWMDSQEYGWQDGKIEFEEFRTSMLLLPPATSIQDIIDLLNHKPKDDGMTMKA